MNIQLYQNSAEFNRVDKTQFLRQGLLKTGYLREGTSVVTPIIVIELANLDGLDKSNYAYIPEFNRYYFITDIVSINSKLVEVYMTVDTLMTYKDAILATKGYVLRNQYQHNGKENQIDDRLPVAQGVDVTVDEIENSVFYDKNHEPSVDDYSFVINGYKIETAT